MKSRTFAAIPSAATTTLSSPGHSEASMPLAIQWHKPNRAVLCTGHRRAFGSSPAFATVFAATSRAASTGAEP
jgi:hypothetical protein